MNMFLPEAYIAQDCHAQKKSNLNSVYDEMIYFLIGWHRSEPFYISSIVSNEQEIFSHSSYCTSLYLQHLMLVFFPPPRNDFAKFGKGKV